MRVQGETNAGFSLLVFWQEQSERRQVRCPSKDELGRFPGFDFGFGVLLHFGLGRELLLHFWVMASVSTL